MSGGRAELRLVPQRLLSTFAAVCYIMIAVRWLWETHARVSMPRGPRVVVKPPEFRVRVVGVLAA